MKEQINFRASRISREQLDWLTTRWGVNQSEALTVAIDRIYQSEANTDDYAMNIWRRSETPTLTRLASGTYLEQMTNRQVAAFVLAGQPYQVYTRADDGDLESVWVNDDQVEIAQLFAGTPPRFARCIVGAVTNANLVHQQERNMQTVQLIEDNAGGLFVGLESGPWYRAIGDPGTFDDDATAIVNGDTADWTVERFAGQPSGELVGEWAEGALRVIIHDTSRQPAAGIAARRYMGLTAARR